MTQMGRMIISTFLVTSLVFSLIACVTSAANTPGHSPTLISTPQPPVSPTAGLSATATRPLAPTIAPSPTFTLRPTLTLTPRSTVATSEPQGQILFTAVYVEQWWALPREAPVPTDIWAINVDGTGYRLWIEDVQYTYAPYVSPDGTQLVYITRPAGNEWYPSSLWIANVDGTRRRQVDYLRGVTQPETVKSFYLQAVWSPDGEWLSYVLGGPGDWRRDPISWLYALHLPSGHTTLVCGPQNTFSSRWISTEKTELAYEVFHSYEGPFPSDHHFRVDVTRPQNVHRVDGPMFQWTSTGQRWAYSRDTVSFPFTGTIKMLASDGSVTRQIAVPNMEAGALWSPDGQWIAYRTIRRVQFPKDSRYMEELWVMDSHGRYRRKLIGPEQFALEYMPLVWSPDSAWLAGFGAPSEQLDEFGANNLGEESLFLLNVSTGQVITLLDKIQPALGYYPSLVWVQ